jgi:hypothetical protein
MCESGREWGQQYAECGQPEAAGSIFAVEVFLILYYNTLSPQEK